MKHFYFFLLGLFAFAANAQIQINTPPPSYYCDQDGNGTETIDLRDNNSAILGSYNPAEYSVKYFLTEEHAQQNMLQVPYLYTIDTATTSQQIFVRVTEIANSDNFAVTTLALTLSALPVMPALPALMPLTCMGGYDLTYNLRGLDPMTITSIEFYTTENDANTGQNPIIQPTNYMASQNSVWVKITSSGSGCYTIAEQQLTRMPITIVDVAINGQTATINATGMGPFIYTIISGPVGFPNPFPYQTSNIITDMPLGMYTIQVEDGCGQIMVITLMVTDTDAPVGETSQTFTEGETLADLEVSGGNIQWYDAPTGGNLLPITTLLTDGTTYYAERSAGRALRAIRLAVTVHLVLSTGSNTLQTLSYYPNPVKNVLNIKNATPINSIAIYNTLGQQVLSTEVNTTETNLDLSALNNGIYFVKVQAGEGNKKTLRIVKE